MYLAREKVKLVFSHMCITSFEKWPEFVGGNWGKFEMNYWFACTTDYFIKCKKNESYDNFINSNFSYCAFQ